MKPLLINVIIFAFMILSSCSSSEKSDILTIPVNVYQDEPILLSEISERIDVIELETTDNSLIGGGNSNRVLLYKDYILFFDGFAVDPKILLFDNKGKFIRRISKRGQGPGEHTALYDVVADFENNRIYIQTLTSKKIICYDFEGNFIKEVSPFEVLYLNFYNDTLSAISIHIESGDITDYKINSVLYKINNDLQIIDSLIISSVNTNKWGAIHNVRQHYITNTDGNVYLFYPIPISLNYLDRYVFRDTLFQIEGKNLIPHLKLEFTDIKSQPERRFDCVYRSSRYVFARYAGKIRGLFCYDLKTGTGKNMRDYYVNDDIHTGEKVTMRPFDSDANMFYYLHTNMDDSDKDEPNPTLYIGTLKK